MFVIGDAGCETKFSLGGIIPSMMAAEAVRDIIVDGDHSKYLVLKGRIFLHQMATKVLNKLTEKDFEELFEIMKDEKYKSLMKVRDQFGSKEIALLFSPRLAWFSIRKLLRF